MATQQLTIFAHVDTTAPQLPPDINTYCSLGHNVNHSCRQCLNRTLTVWGYDADAYDKYALAETGKRSSQEHRKRWYVPGDVDTAHTHRQRNYGITPQQYLAMLAAQNHVCVLCGHPETRRHKGTLCALAVDHNHTTGKVRGLLCTSCNQLIGHLEKQGHGWAAKGEAYLAYHAGQPHTHGPWCQCLDTPAEPTPPQPRIPQRPQVEHTVEAETATAYQVCQRCYAPADSAYCSEACATGDRDAMRTRQRVA